MILTLIHWLGVLLLILCYIFPPLIISSLLTDGTYCEQGWVGYNGDCYKVTKTVDTYENQRALCAQDDAELASVLEVDHPSLGKWGEEFHFRLMDGMHLIS